MAAAVRTASTSGSISSCGICWASSRRRGRTRIGTRRRPIRIEPIMATIDKFCAPGVYDPATYSQGIKVSGAQAILFLSGQVAYTADGGVALRGDFKGQARGALEAIKALVESQGGSMANVVKI